MTEEKEARVERLLEEFYLWFTEWATDNGMKLSESVAVLRSGLLVMQYMAVMHGPDSKPEWCPRGGEGK